MAIQNEGVEGQTAFPPEGAVGDACPSPARFDELTDPQRAIVNSNNTFFVGAFADEPRVSGSPDDMAGRPVIKKTVYQ